MIDSEDVLVARIVSAETNSSTSANTFFFTSRFSKTASITKSVLANADLSIDPDTNAFKRLAASGDRRFLPSSLSISL
ncbi:unannotated protein [freshwater metagenome]|uniref:Unannotated protein n=1 Tax=freshwater metagenome TaxID=449393 RepID=A0A6J7IZP3_9ZZZZ